MSEQPRISVTIMHHPRRRERIPALVQAVRPLPAQVVADPDPTGIPSPLRTAKVAWSTIADGATHHLVLQDDIRLVEGFADHLRRAITSRPLDGISLYSHWDSPHNSYFVRRAAVAGSPFAPLSTREWTPTQGFCLPVDRARDLAKFLSTIPDEVKDDDEMVVIFCREQGIEVVATVPHLVDHRDEPTLAAHPGSFHATVFSARPALPAGHWDRAQLRQHRLSRMVEDSGYVVEFRHSRCGLRFTGVEPVEHEFPWYWHDSCALIGVEAEDILAAAEAYRPNGRLATELWAAGFLLGADAGRLGAAAPDPQLSTLAVRSWITSGLSAADRSGLTEPARQELVDLGLAAVRCGCSSRLAVSA
ncbi:MAG TPA: hypothetical protein VHC49_01605 [Mycobacteriales bacterium]|nr:hypothetical protein [Mycobacteriales bacterium]